MVPSIFFQSRLYGSIPASWGQSQHPWFNLSILAQSSFLSSTSSVSLHFMIQSQYLGSISAFRFSHIIRIQSQDPRSHFNLFSEGGRKNKSWMFWIVFVPKEENISTTANRANSFWILSHAILTTNNRNWFKHMWCKEQKCWKRTIIYFNNILCAKNVDQWTDT